jgi:hypothetical protein
MAYGFVSAYGLALLYATVIVPSAYPLVFPVSAWLALAGLVGGMFPDIDQLEFWGPKQISRYFVHKKTLHYISGYLIASVIFLGLASVLPMYLFSFLFLACACFAAWFHSFMDPLDGWRNGDPKQGIYEHFTRRWLPSLRKIMFAGMWEWVVQAFAALWFIAISAHLSQFVVSGWLFATACYAVIWGMSATFDLHRAADRQARELRRVRPMRGVR